MGLLKVDESKCKRDGVCASECMSTIIKVSGNSYPVIEPEWESMCMLCGHCVAVCPYGALSHESIPVEDSPTINTELLIDEDQAVQFLRSRRSIRFFQERPVEREKIQRLIEAARFAPTGSNSQLVEWLVLSDKGLLHKIAGMAVVWLRQLLQDNPQMVVNSPYLPLLIKAWDLGFDPVLRKATVLVIAVAPQEALTGQTDVTLALSYFDLLAPTMGLGTCWAGLMQMALHAQPSIRELVGIPEGYPYQYPIMLGYPKMKYYRLPERKPPKVTYL